MLSGVFPSPVARAQLPDPSCTVQTGGRIQLALDNAQPNSRITVCPGIYTEALTVHTNGILLEGKPGAILDGTVLVGTRYGITIQPNTHQVTISGFDIQKYANPLNANDPSGGILSQGDTGPVHISNLTIHDNGWVGILAASGGDQNWTIENVTIRNHTFAGLFAQGTDHFDVHNSVVTNSKQGIVMANPKLATLHHNTITGAGRVGIMLMPYASKTTWPTGVTVSNNSVTGTWKMGVYSLAVRNSRIGDNTIQAAAGTMVAGDSREISLWRGELEPDQDPQPADGFTLEQHNAKPAIDDIRQTFRVQSDIVNVQCAGANCLLDATARFFDWLFPTAEAQAPPPTPLCGPSPCDPHVIDTLIDRLVTQRLTLLTDPRTATDTASLATCQGQPDSCLEDEFFNQPPGSTPNGWTLPLQNALHGPAVDITFIDAGTRRTTSTKADRYVETDLDQAFDTIVLCRIKIQGDPAPHNCAAAPRVFDYGLDVTWTTSQTAQHASMWRLKLPTDSTHDSMDAIHGPDATLFKHSSRPHDASSPPPTTTYATTTVPPTDPLRVTYAGTGVLKCVMIPSAISTSGITNGFPGTIPPTIPAADCGDPTLLKGTAPMSTLWCTGDLAAFPTSTRSNETIHATLATELSSGLWNWSRTCGIITPPIATNWTTLFGSNDLATLGHAQGDYYNATTPTARSTAAAAAQGVMLQAVARHLALAVPNQGMPITPNFGNATASTGSNVILLEYANGSRNNIRLNKLEVQDATLGWVKATIPGLVGFTPTRATFDVTYTALNGDTATTPLTILIGADAPHFSGSAIRAHYQNKTIGNIVAWDSNQRDYAEGYLYDSTHVHAYTLVNITNTTELTGLGLYDTGIMNATGNLTYCLRQLWSANASGNETNYDAFTRLAASNQTPNLTCGILPTLASVNLQFFSDLLVTLELRKGTALEATYEIIGDPWKHLANSTNPNATHSLSEALPVSLDPVVDDVRTGSIRLVVTIPQATSPQAEALVVERLLSSLKTTVGVFSIELEDVPLTTDLAHTVETASNEFGSIILVPSGVLPVAGRAYAPQDKLMTIQGLASSPRVITIGAGDAHHVSAWSRLGPTATLAPKPDFVAPSPVGTTAGSVANALSFVEALALGGLKTPDTIRAALAAFALPTYGESGGPATFYEQGFGVLDLAPFLTNDSDAPGLGPITLATHQDMDVLRPKIAHALGLSEAAVNTASYSALLGLASPGTPLLREAVTKTLLNLTIDAPTLPASISADFGVVNRVRPGTANFTPMPINGLINATANHTRLLLQRAGYTGTQLDDVMKNVTDLIQVSAMNGNYVTLNATHYYFEDTLSKDLLYTMYSEVLNSSIQDNAQALPDLPVDLTPVLSPLWNWSLAPKYFVNETSGNVKLNVTIDNGCGRLVPVQGTMRTLDAILTLLNAEAKQLEGTTKGPAADTIMAQIPQDSNAFVTPATQDLIQAEAGELACLHDQQRLLGYARVWATELKQLKLDPWGSLDANESINGTWNVTPMGHAINDTLPTIGFLPGALQQRNSTIVLDAVIDLIDRVLGLMESKLSLLAPPHISATVEGQPTQLVTDATRTAAAPLGLYLGLAKMKSHNVSVYNPLTGEPIVTRNITIPLPSVLWNNPTLELNMSYRHGVPLPNDTMLMHSPRTKIFDNTQVDVNFTHLAPDGIIVPLLADATASVSRESGSVQDLLRQIQALQAGLHANLTNSSLTDRVTSVMLGNIAQGLKERNDTLNTINGTSAALLALTGGSVIQPAFEAVMARLVSRLAFQNNVTNQTGVATLSNLFPGNWTLLQPYAYPLPANLTQVLPYNDAGLDGLAGPFHDPTHDTGRMTDQVVMNLPTHPTGISSWSSRSLVLMDGKLQRPTTPDPGDGLDPTGPPQSCFNDYACIYELPLVEINGQARTYHQFGLHVQGPDLLGVACRVLSDVEQDLGTSLVFTGCGVPVLPADLTSQQGRLTRFVKCLIGEYPQGLTHDEQRACADFVAQSHAASASCRTDGVACMRAGDIENVTRELQDIIRILDSTIGPQQLYTPFPHSPTRALLTDPAKYGLTPTALLPATYAINHDAFPSVTNETLLNDIANVIADLTSFINQTVRTIPPPNTTRANLTEPEGILGHVTDKISGLDWTHFGVLPYITEVASDPVTQVATAQSAITDSSDQNLTGDLFGRLQNDEERITWYNNAVHRNWSTLRAWLDEGWRPNGTASLGPLSVGYPADVNPQTLSPVQVCQNESLTSGLTGAYFSCGQLAEPVAYPDIRGLGNVDSIGFTNVLIEMMKQRPDFVTNQDSRRDILQRAAGISVTPLNENWTRTSDGIMMQSNGTAPNVGLLMYDVPVPEQEFLRYRLSSEMTLQNTGLLMITTGNDAAAKAIVSAVGLLNATSITTLDTNATNALGQSEAAVGAAASSVLKVTNVLNTQLIAEGLREDPLLRIEALGIPVGIEQKTTPQLGQGLAENRVMESKGLVVVRPSAYYNYSRIHEVQTLKTPVSTMHIIMVYFPTAAQSLSPATEDSVNLSQKLVLKNFSIELTTYIGIGGNDNTTSSTYSLPIPIRYNPRIEDWKLLLASPDQSLQTPTQPNGRLNVTVTLGGATVYPSSLSQFRSPTYTDFASSCVDTVAPGYPGAVAARPRSIPGAPSGTFTYTQADDCWTDEVEGLRPRHVLNGLGGYVENWTTSTPNKKIIDSLQYVTNVGKIEDFTTEGMLALPVTCSILCDPTTLLTTASLPVVEGVPDAAGAAEAALEQALVVATGVPNAYLESPNSLLEVGAATPFIHMSFMPDKQWSAMDRIIAAAPRHGYIMLTETDARALLAGASNPSPAAEFTYAERFEQGTQVTPDALPVRWIPGEVLHQRVDTDYAGIVMAHKFWIDSEQQTDVLDDPSTYQFLTANFEFIIGNGASGTGIAVQAMQVIRLYAEDSDRKSFLENFSITVQGGTPEVKVFALGTPLSAGSDCEVVRIMRYVSPWFRCTGGYEIGVDPAAFKQGVGAGNAYSRALDLLTTSEADAVRDLNQRPTNERDLTRALAFMLPDPATPLTPTASLNVQQIAQNALAAKSLELKYANLTRALLDSLKDRPELAGTLGSLNYSALIENATRGFENATQLGAHSNASVKSIHNLIRIPQPHIADTGEPPHLVTTKIVPPWLDKTAPFVNTNGLQRTNAFVEEWTSRVANASFNASIRASNGAWTNTTTSWLPNDATLNTRAPLARAAKGAASVVIKNTAYVFGGDATSRAIQTYNLSNGASSIKPSTLLDDALTPTAFTDGTNAYIQGAGAKIVKYDPTTDTVTRLASGDPELAGRPGASVTWTGSKAYYFAGGTSTAAYSDIREFDPAADTLTLKSATFPSARYGACAVWNGTLAFVIGGTRPGSAGPLDEIVTYDPVTGSIMVRAHLPHAAGACRAIYESGTIHIIDDATGDIFRYDITANATTTLATTLDPARSRPGFVAANDTPYILGGSVGGIATSSVLSYNTTRDMPTWRVLTTGPTPTTIPLTFTNGNRYVLNLTAHDTYGNLASDQIDVTIDTDLPYITTMLPAFQWATDATSMSWDVVDNASGLQNASIEKWDASTLTWKPTSTALASNLIGTTSTQTLSITVSLPNAQNASYRVKATDCAGNVWSSPSREIKFDLTLPDLSGFFSNLDPNGFITNLNSIGVLVAPSINTTTNATDTGSGLRSLRVFLKNQTSEITLYESNALGGVSTVGTLTYSTFPWPNASYQLRANATDIAGNTRSVTNLTSITNFQYYPTVRVLAPSVISTANTVGALLTANVSLPDYPGLSVNETTFRVTDKTNTTLIHTGTIPNAIGNVSSYWNSTAYVTTHAYGIGVVARFYDTYTYLNATDSNITGKPEKPATPGLSRELNDYELLGALNGTADYDQFVIQSPVKCGTHFKLVLDSLDGTLVNLYTTPIGNSTSDPSMWAVTDTGKTHEEADVNAPVGITWIARVNHTATDTAYKLHFLTSSGCNAGGNIETGTGGGGSLPAQRHADTASRNSWSVE